MAISRSELNKKHISSQRYFRKNGLGSRFWRTTSVVLAILLLLSIFTGGFKLSTMAEKVMSGVSSVFSRAGANSKGNFGATSEKVAVEFYVMSQCPYGVQVEDAIAPVLEKLKGNVDFSLEFIGQEDSPGDFQSLHGANEVAGNKVQLCAAKYNPDTYMKMVLCMNKNAQGIPGNWESCASDNKLDSEKIKACYEGEEGTQLLSDSFKLAAQKGAGGSPTMFIGGTGYNGARGENDFLAAICNSFSGKTKPVACKDIPEPVKFTMTVLTDSRCKDCASGISQIKSAFKSLFPGVTYADVDYSDSSAKDLISKYNIKLLPAYIIDKKMDETDTWKAKQVNPAAFQLVDDKYVINPSAVGASFDPTAEICDNKIDDNGNGIIDCEDSQCTEDMLCRPEMKNNLQVFIMSDCPYGKEAIKALKEVKDNFGDKISFAVHYIASENADGTFASLHGAYEAEEDIRQLCANKYSPDKWFDYIYCRSVEGIKDKDWKTCAQSSGIDQAKVDACVTGEEGKSLLKEDVKSADALGISASPTWLANNRFQFGGIYADPVKVNLCQYNSGLEGCSNTLGGATPSTQNAPSGSC